MPTLTSGARTQTTHARARARTRARAPARALAHAPARAHHSNAAEEEEERAILAKAKAKPSLLDQRAQLLRRSVPVREYVVRQYLFNCSLTDSANGFAQSVSLRKGTVGMRMGRPSASLARAGLLGSVA
jgi:hypothetical protein